MSIDFSNINVIDTGKLELADAKKYPDFKGCYSGFLDTPKTGRCDLILLHNEHKTKDTHPDFIVAQKAQKGGNYYKTGRAWWQKRKDGTGNKFLSLKFKRGGTDVDIDVTAFDDVGDAKVFSFAG